MNDYSSDTLSTLGALEPVGATTTWDGSPTTIQPLSDTLLMPQTPNGSTVFAYQNKATQNNDGSLSLTSGGGQPQILDVPALLQQPTILVSNWQANNLTVNNISQNTATPIWVEAFGPGLPGQTPITVTNGTPFKLSPQPSATSVATGVTAPRNMLLRMQSNTGDLAIIAVIGGPSTGGSNAYVFALNSSTPGEGQGYTKAVSGNSYDFQFNWSTSVIYIANMSPSTSAAVTLNLIGL
ncbi:hypothetical protein [Sphingosinicella sp. BN140058]|uniref:hypothetical protein n=1 Tax=Sphingosinicella sp. BN140058 TaxID=1892855 RepID=UPI0010117244|nr:hypothetical protein [Sphingosinicella sp. BN140058]QAY75871.1 hypothetical protein ETR14_04495 [Sphingosinicella sp. BN140058]